MPKLLEPEQRVLATLNQDGSRRWLRPRVSKGRFLTARRVVAYLLIAIFTAIPYITINSKPAILLDIPAREFTFFGFTFLPTDTLLLALFMLTVFVGIFLITALFGRVWCGWACPQTVYMEFLYRPIERLLEGAPGKKQTVKRASGVRKFVKYALFLAASMFLAHIFLAYFVGIERLSTWVTQSPLEHPTSFIVMVAVTALMLFDFGFLREQVCLVACPYGRFQSVMLDRNSLIVTYDNKRGEPRGKISKRRKKSGDVGLPVVSEADARGDCIDCKMCVTTCPTGIDIRDGLQMECIGCAQCIDACDAVMEKVGKPRGLIRYSSQAAVESGRWRMVRPRVVLYPAVLAVLVSAFVLTLSQKSTADVTLLRGLGRPFMVLDDGRVSNQLRVKVTNRSKETQAYTLSTPLLESAELLVTDEERLTVAPGETQTIDALVLVPAELFADGSVSVSVQVDAGGETIATKKYRLVGPDPDRLRPEDEGEPQR